MSTLRERVSGPRVQYPMSFADQLRTIGVSPLPRERVRRFMHAAALGHAPTESRVFLWLWGLVRVPESWRVFTASEYRALERAPHSKTKPTFGIPIPQEIVAIIARIEKSVPHARIEIHALRSDDPWVRVFDPLSGTAEWIGGWYGRGNRRRIFLGT